MLKIFEISTSLVRSSSSSSAVCAGSERRRRRRLRCPLQRQHQLWSRQTVGICCSAAANTCASLVSCASCLVLRFGSAVASARLSLLRLCLCSSGCATPHPAPPRSIMSCQPAVAPVWDIHELLTGCVSPVCLSVPSCVCLCVCACVRCVSVCVCVFSAIKNAALPAQDAATCHTSSLLSARLCRLSPAAFYFIVCCCRNSWSVKGLYLPPPPFPLPLHHSFPSLFLHFTFLWAIEQQPQLQKRELLLASVSLSTSTLASPS